MGGRRPERARGADLQVRRDGCRRRQAPQGGPVRVPGGGAAEDRVGALSLASRLAGRRLARAPCGHRASHRADVGLRGARRLVAPRARLARARRRADRARGRARVHARRADAGDAASVRAVVGLPGERLLRPARSARRAGRPSRVRRRAPCERGRRAARLGPGPLPARRVGARALRRDSALRACRPAPRRASRLGHARLQLRPPRGAELPARERALLAGGVPRGRAARRRGRLHALPRLLA